MLNSGIFCLKDVSRKLSHILYDIYAKVNIKNLKSAFNIKHIILFNLMQQKKCYLNLKVYRFLHCL